MAKTQQDFLDEARQLVPEVSVEEVEARRQRGDGFVLLDVREKDEVRTGYIDEAISVPRGFLEMQVSGSSPGSGSGSHRLLRWRACARYSPAG